MCQAGEASLRLEAWAQNTRCQRCDHRHHYDKGPCEHWKVFDPSKQKYVRCGCKKCRCLECRLAKSEVK